VQSTAIETTPLPRVRAGLRPANRGTDRTVTGRCERGAFDSGQTEPLPALVAVALVCATLSGYAALTTDVVSDLGRERALAEVTSDRIWHDSSVAGIYPTEHTLRGAVATETLPRGHHVYAAVSYVGDDGRVVERVGFDTQGEPYTVTTQPSGDTAERAVAVEHRDGDIRPGTLTVVVWNGTTGGAG